MNKDILRGKWTQVKGSIRSKWGEITNDDLDMIQGDAEKFIGVLQERYGYARDKAEREIEEFLGRTQRTGTTGMTPGTETEEEKKRRVS
jgi:uncharacterized protein YjbJ (UPF0337 family)